MSSSMSTASSISTHTRRQQPKRGGLDSTSTLRIRHLSKPSTLETCCTVAIANSHCWPATRLIHSPGRAASPRKLTDLPVRTQHEDHRGVHHCPVEAAGRTHSPDSVDRKSTRLNSSHLGISYAVFCLK